MLRDERVVAVDDVIVALKRSLEDMADEISAVHKQPRLAEALRQATAVGGRSWSGWRMRCEPWGICPPPPTPTVKLSRTLRRA